MPEFVREHKAPSTKNIVHEFEPLFNDFRDQHDVKDEIFYNMMVAVTEGINNAAGHGNKFDKKKFVTLKLTYENDELTCIIQDEGSGYNPKEIADPREPENLLKDRGRGVFLMRSLTKEFSVLPSNNGNQVKLVFHIP